MTDIRRMKVNKKRCHTCPFNEHGDRRIRHMVEQRCTVGYKGEVATQICHGTNNTTLCRGARDHQIQFFHRLGVIEEPTDVSWEKKYRELTKR